MTGGSHGHLSHRPQRRIDSSDDAVEPIECSLSERRACFGGDCNSVGNDLEPEFLRRLLNLRPVAPVKKIARSMRDAMPYGREMM